VPPTAAHGAMGGSTGAQATTTLRGSPTSLSLRSSLRSFAASGTTPSAAAATAAATSASTPALSAAFSSMRQQFTEALDKTSTISKRLYHEWENLATDRACEDPLRSYDDDIWQHAAPAPAPAPPTTASGAVPRTMVASTDNPLAAAAGSTGAAPYSSYGSSPDSSPSSSSATAHAGSFPPPPHFVAAEMEMHVAALQNYCMNAQRVRHDVPPPVWESLAQLERLRQSLLLRAAPPAPHPSSSESQSHSRMIHRDPTFPRPGP
jgi:hypothetical protein